MITILICWFLIAIISIYYVTKQNKDGTLAESFIVTVLSLPVLFLVFGVLFPLMIACGCADQQGVSRRFKKIFQVYCGLGFAIVTYLTLN